MREKYFRYSSGVTLIEVILAIAILIGVTVFIFGLQWQVEDLENTNIKTLTAINSVEKKLLSYFTNSDSSEFLSQNVYEYPFTQCESVFSPNYSWGNSWRSTTTVSLSLLTGSLDKIRKYGKDCGGQPLNFKSENFGLSYQIDLGQPATTVDIYKDQIAVSLKPNIDQPADLAIVNSQNGDFYLVDVGLGVNKLDVVEGRIFAAQNGTTSQLYSLANQSSQFSVVSTSTLPNVAGVRPEAVSIFYFDSKIYIGTKRTAGHEFHIFDVSNASSPVWLGSIEINHNINDIAVSDGLAFLATSGNIRDLIVLDVHDPARISRVAEIDIPGNEDGKSVSVVGHHIFLGRYKGTASGREEVCVFEYKPNSSGGVDVQLIDRIQTSGDVNNIVYGGGYLYSATSNSTKELQVFSLSRKNQIEKVFDYDLPGPATGIDLEDGMIAVTSGNKLFVFNQD